MKKSELVKVAKEFNELFGLEPEIDTSLKLDELKAVIQEATQYYQEGDELSDAVKSTLQDLDWEEYIKGLESKKEKEETEKALNLLGIFLNPEDDTDDDEDDDDVDDDTDDEEDDEDDDEEEKPKPKKGKKAPAKKEKKEKEKKEKAAPKAKREKREKVTASKEAKGIKAGVKVTFQLHKKRGGGKCTGTVSHIHMRGDKEYIIIETKDGKVSKRPGVLTIKK